MLHVHARGAGAARGAGEGGERMRDGCGEIGKCLESRKEGMRATSIPLCSTTTSEFPFMRAPRARSSVAPTHHSVSTTLTPAQITGNSLTHLSLCPHSFSPIAADLQCSPAFGCGRSLSSTTSSSLLPSTALGLLGTLTSTTSSGK